MNARFDRLLDYVDGKLPVVRRAQPSRCRPSQYPRVQEFPRGPLATVWSNNPNERLNREIRRRTDEWAEGRRYLGLDILARSRIRALPDTESEADTDTIMALSA